MGKSLNNNKRKTLSSLVLLLIGLLIVNYLSDQYYLRVDLTRDQRYTLSEISEDLLSSLDEPVNIKVYLQGEFPAEFKRLQRETKQLLEEFKAVNPELNFRFIDPMSNAKNLVEKGLQPSRLTVQEGGTVSEAIIFPWALISYGDKEEKVSLLVDAAAQSQEDQLLRSIENLEFSFSDALYKVSSEKGKSIAILKGNGQLHDIQMFSFLKQLGDYYHLAEFTMDSVATNPHTTLAELNRYDLAIIAKPMIPFTEDEKLTLDQYIMNGGKSVWLIDNVYAEVDSLVVNGSSLAFNRDLGLTDLLFQYGVRINYNITKDRYSGSLRLAAGNSGNQIQYENFPWVYYPKIYGNPGHPITKSTDPVLLKFPSSIDTLSNGIKKTILLRSSPFAKVVGTPSQIRLDEIAENRPQSYFSDQNIIFGVLLEGSFRSAYELRTKPFETDQFKATSARNSMLVISDGDIIRNEVMGGEPLPIDRELWTQQPLGNAEVLSNSIRYMLDDYGLMNLRSKQLQLQFLDKEKAYSERSYWQLINVFLPLLILVIFGLIFRFVRHRRYASGSS